MRILNRDDLMNILYGCTILGTGGGGSLTAAGAQLKHTTIDEARGRIAEVIDRYLEQNPQEEMES